MSGAARMTVADRVAAAPVASGAARREGGVRDVLEWAFGAECARLDFGEGGAVGGIGYRGFGFEAVLQERAQLGGVRIDTSPGVSPPADDAEIVAGVVATLPEERGGRRMACIVADLARAGAAPDWMPGARPRCVPVRWRRCKHGWRAGVEDGDGWGYCGRRGWVSGVGKMCPVTWQPSAARIAAARRHYLDWWGALQDIAWRLRTAGLRRWVVLDDMPPMTPWREG